MRILDKNYMDIDRQYPGGESFLERLTPLDVFTNCCLGSIGSALKQSMIQNLKMNNFETSLNFISLIRSFSR